MPREIKTTLAVDGEAAFKRAINEANTSIRNIGTQLTLASAKFKQDGDAMKLMESRSKALKAEVSQQNEIVKALEKAVADSTKAYGENSAKTEKWEAELNRARTRLVNLQNELTLNEAGLDQHGRAFEENTQKAADYQATLQTIGKNVSFKAVTDGIGGITGVVEGAVKKVAGLAKTIREAFVGAGQWADELMTNAVKYKMDVEELQRWQNAAEFIDTDVDTIIGARDKLGKKMSEGWKKDGLDMWEILGIDMKDANGNWRDQMDVMWEVGETLMNMAKVDKSDVRADEYAMEVFGKSWRELLPLFTAGREEWEKTVASQRVVSKERVEALGELDDANKALENSWDVAKYSFLAELAPVITDVTDAVTEMLNAFNDWMDTDEGKQAMQELSDAVRELFSGLTNLKFEDVIDSVKDALNGIRDAFIWINEHKGEIVDTLKAIALGFVGLKVVGLGANLMQIFTGLTSGLRNGGTGTAAANAANAAANGGTAAAASGTGTAVATGANATNAANAAAGAGATSGVVLGSGGTGFAAGGVGTGLSGTGTALSFGTVAGGTLGLAAWTYGVSELVNSVNRSAQKAREVETDANRLAENMEETKRDYSFGGINREAGAQSYIQGLMRQTGDQASASQYSQMRYLAELMGPDVMKLFEYTNKTGKHNKLTDMLDMGDRYAAVAAMIMQAAGVEGYDLNPGLEAYNRFRQNGGLGTEAYTELTNYFSNSMQYDKATGKMIIPGATGSNEIMPVINGVPLANMSGYVMTAEQSKPKYSNGILWYGRDDIENAWGQNGTWDPNQHMSIVNAVQETLMNSSTTAAVTGMLAAALTSGNVSLMSEQDARRLKENNSDMFDKAKAGIREGISGIAVTLDGYTVGRLLVPYVNQMQGEAAQ